MVNAGHKVRVRMTATLDDGTDLDLGFGDRGEAEVTLGSGELSSYVESLVARMDVGDTHVWNTPAVRVLGPQMVGRDLRYEVTLLADYGRALSAVAWYTSPPPGQRRRKAMIRLVLIRSSQNRMWSRSMLRSIHIPNI